MAYASALKQARKESSGGGPGSPRRQERWPGSSTKAHGRTSFRDRPQSGQGPMAQRDIALAEQDSNRIIEGQLDDRLRKIQAATSADVLTYVGGIVYGAEDSIKDAIEGIQNRSVRLFVLLETNGGYIEVAERIAHTFRHHYQRVDFAVPNFAMSAGTVLVMSGDSIHMDYSSILGPIDPQVQRPGADAMVPALGYLEQYERLIKKSADGTLTTAELTYLIQNFDPAELYRYEQERELSIALLEQWLVKYKFKNWKKTETKKATVTAAMKKARAQEIARQLNKTDKWHSHSRGIHMEVLRRDLKLQIDDFGEDPDLGPRIREYYRLLKDYQLRRAHYYMALHTDGRYEGF